MYVKFGLYEWFFDVIIATQLKPSITSRGDTRGGGKIIGYPDRSP